MALDKMETTNAAKPASASPEAPKVPNAASAAPQAPVGKGGVLPGSLLSREEKTETQIAKEEIKKKTASVRKIVVSFLFLSLAWAGWVQVNISKTNAILSVVGVQTNAGQEADQLKKEAKKLKTSNQKLEKEIKKIEQKIENKNYTTNSDEVRVIREQQIVWFDGKNEDGSINFGLADAIPRIKDYFNSRTYSDPESILSGIHGEIDIQNLQISRNGLSFSVDSSQILGKIFYLNIELIEMINSFPFLKNGVIEQFARQKNDEEDDSMRFNVKLDRQLNDEEDPADIRFQEYLEWLNASSTN